MNEFIEKILQNLTTNGFPAKRVSLPTDKMYESADNRGLSFNDVIKQLQTDHGINAEVGADKIVFSKTPEEMNPADMLRQAQEMMAKMDPEELRRIQDMVMNMSPEQKEEMMKKGKDLGIL